MTRRKQIRKLYEALDSAKNFEQWHNLALQIDRHTGGEAWRHSSKNYSFDLDLVKSHTQRLNGLRQSGAHKTVLEFLTESLYRLNHDLTRPNLYQDSLIGPKQVIEAYFWEAERCIRYLCEHPNPEFSDAKKLRTFVNAADSFGKTALLLSGGATLGYYHLGVAKALWDQGLLPQVISGSSMGSIIAAAICTRSDHALSAWFDRPDEIEVRGLNANALGQWHKQGSIFSQDGLRRAIEHNVEDLTFAEAFAKTGRILNISVSPTRANQKPRVLNYQTAPNALIVQACVASSAVPGLFPSVTLTQRTPDGAETPYLPSESWVDGSLEGDLPKLRLSRLQNVNHFIVSQTNPHVLPIARAKSGKGMLAKLVGVSGRFAQVQSGYLLEIFQDIAPSDWAKTLLRRTQNFIAQDYEGDINIHPRFRFDLYQLMMRNPTQGQLRTFILEGEKATWPKLSLVRYQTLVARVLSECVQRLEGRVKN